jgi:predicted permease
VNRWITRLVLRLVPASWRGAVARDLEEEAQAQKRGGAWLTWQALRVGLDLRGTFALGALAFDLRHALRSLGHARWFTLGAALTFALGIGINIGVFSSVDRLVFRRLPYHNPGELVLIRECMGPNRCSGSMPSLVAFEAQRGARSLGELAVAGPSGAYRVTPASEDSPTVRLTGVSPNLLRVLGVAPVAGRDMNESDVAAKRHVALLAFESWHRRFDGAADVLGRVIGTAADPVTIVGILPRGFMPPAWTAPDPTWDGLVSDYSGWAAFDPRPKSRVMVPIARLEGSASLGQARAEIAALAESLAPQLPPATGRGGGPAPTIRVDPLEGELFSRFEEQIRLVVIAAAVVLLMACTNLAGLLLARGRGRQQEVAMRTALGAPVSRLVVLAVLETMIVCTAGAVVAFGIWAATSRTLAAILPPLLSRYMAEVTDWRVAAFALGLAWLCALVAGVWPGVRAARVDVAATLQRGSGAMRSGRLPGGRSLLVVEAALGVLLVLGGVLALRTYANLKTEGLGFQPDGLYRLTALAPARLAPAQGLASYEEILDAVSHVPGVTAVAGSDSVVTSPTAPMRGFSKDGSLKGGRYEVTASYFSAIGTTLAAGREFTADEVRRRDALAILNVTAARVLFGSAPLDDLVGRPLVLPGETARTVVGVVGDVRESYGEVTQPAVYVPLGAEPSSYNELLVRMAPGTSPDLAVLRQRITERVGHRTVSLRAASTSVEASLDEPHFRAVLLGSLAMCALLLACAGLYAVAAFDASRRRHEVGVRMTLGASAAQIRRLVILGAARPAALGVLIGGIAAYWSAGLLEAFLYQVDGRDPLSYAAVALLLGSAVVLAAWLPARRAARTDPVVVLRAQ